MAIVGVSFDEPEDTEEWAIDQEFLFELWSDVDRILAVHYGASDDYDDNAPSRITKLIGADGSLLLEYVEDVSVGTHPDEVLEDCQMLFLP